PSDFDGHGIHCAGDACAVSDNGIGVASPGFNCQIMALRAGYMSSSGVGYVDLGAAIPAVYYAIDKGAEAISMSFGGGPFPPFQTALEAAYNAGLILVAAAGNEHTSFISYPAGYNFVIAVAATTHGDYLADFSNYGDWITVCAPGVDVMSTTVGGGWGNMGGTSMATPITAGVAALVKSLKPDWDCVDVANWLFLTADNIDSQNPQYVGQMGGGRINAAQSVDLFVSVDSVWVENESGGSRLYFDQEGSLYVRYHKYFGNAYNVTLTMSSPNPRVTFSQATHTVGTLLEGESADNSSEPFILSVQNGGSAYEIIELEGHFSGDGFEFTQPLELLIGRGQILIIDADQNQNERTASYYETTLDNLGYTWETWRRADRVELGAELSQYEAVIHFSGTAQSNIFPGNDWEDLDDYLDAGGNVIVTGQNVAQDLSSSQPSVLEDVLRVQYLAPISTTTEIYGAPGNSLSAGMRLIMSGNGGAGNQTSMDVVSALLGAQPLFVYDTLNTVELAGVRTRIGLSDLFFCAFGIEGISDSTTVGNGRIEVLGMMLNAFGLTAVESPGETLIPSEIALLPPYPNPFNSQQKITYHLSQPGPLTISIYNVLGREVAHYHRDFAPAGASDWIWRVGPELGSGIYFIQLAAQGKATVYKTTYLK
ncbi:MAG: S8 family serine peptidase, partial [bacterium]